MESVHILVVVAGMSEPSNSDVLAGAFIDGIRTVEGVTAEKVRLKSLRIDHFTLEHYRKECTTEDDFCILQEKIERAKGIAIASPIWSFSVPAHLKNVIDRMGAFALDEETHSRGQLKGMPFYFIYTGGAPMIAWKALMYLTTLHVSEAMKYYGGTVIGRTFEPRAMRGKGEFSLVVDQRLKTLERMRGEGARFARVVRTFSQQGRLPLRQRLRYRFFTWVYRIGNRIMYPIARQQ